MVSWASAGDCRRCGSSPGVNADKRLNERSNDEKARIRRSGLTKIKSGAVATIMFVVALITIPLTGHEFAFRPYHLIIGLTPVAWLLAGILQIVTGTPFEELSERWDNLPWWRRGCIGISVFVGGLVVVLAIAVLVVSVFIW